ncbi:MAG: Crp/Fnr family transcriptional regulator [Erysipelotrichales bacterium]|nr:Crp/Fnr family transcriptional regulator [Erysipelotrichales bacterium]MBQ1386055.1 Crp/Fnr family transcriptional regulator [Erysipelotrichales bacterium]MBQ2309487.1 Crp/Fnr family transcriptional regulator [Erysipelotrichales bacterium]MBQ2478549.1 Crp/Fnr family transcriptional regulator [Erysipelotrichales bacterium]MBQ4374672.1 Crp/Fnr family transcriptional regulator [Erysipelotrichales bacterium]
MNHFNEISFRKCLEAVPFFAGLPAEAVDGLAEHAKYDVRSNGSTLFSEGDAADSIYIIQKGRVKLSRYIDDGQEIVLDILHDGQAIWENMFLVDKTYSYSAICLTDVDMYEISREVIQKVLEEQPKVAMSMVSFLSKKLQEANERAIFLSIRDPMVRLAGFLLYKDRTCIGPEICLRLNDIAASIGLRMETVSRSLKKFEKDGLLRRMGQGRILIVDHEGLKKIYKSTEKTK